MFWGQRGFNFKLLVLSSIVVCAARAIFLANWNALARSRLTDRRTTTFPGVLDFNLLLLSCIHRGAWPGRYGCEVGSQPKSTDIQTFGIKASLWQSAEATTGHEGNFMAYQTTNLLFLGRTA